MAYATRSDLTAYISAELAGDLPSENEQDRLLDRASEIIDEATLLRIDDEDSDHLEAAKKATVAQVEWWLESGEASDVAGPVQGYSIGSLQIQYGAGANRTVPLTLARRAKRHLFLAGLLDRRVGVR